MAKSNVSRTFKLKGVYLQNSDSLTVYNYDGSAKTSFWLVFNDDQIAVLSFAWGVRPGAKPNLERAIVVTHGKIVEAVANIKYDFQTLKGTISASGILLEINIKESHMRLLDPWIKSKKTYNFSEIENLITKTPIKILKPNP